MNMEIRLFRGLIDAISKVESGLKALANLLKPKKRTIAKP